MPTDPEPSIWVLPPATEADAHGLVGVGGDLEPGTILAAYRSGLFPMPVGVGQGDEALGWWSPDPRAILPLDGLRVSRSLRRSCRDLEVRIDTAFDEVVAACAAPDREGRWITDEVAAAYGRLHRLGWAHSVEAWRGDDLVGGLYGIAIGGLFAGESMFHRATDASKVALVGLVALLRQSGDGLLDVQWTTPHLRSLGAVDIPQADYLARLEVALTRPLPPAFA